MKKNKKKKKSFFGIVKKTLFNDNNGKEKSSFSITEVIIVMLISILFGVIVGYFINYSKSDVNKDSNLSEIVDTYSNIVNNYYGKLDKNELSNAAIKAMIESLKDPYSNYMDSETSNEFNESIEGSFVGIGVVIMNGENYNTIIEVYEDSPAEKAGIKAEDVIIKVDGKDVKGLLGSDLAKIIRGQKGTIVNITVLRNGEEISFDVKRDIIDLISVTDKIIEYDGKNIGYINISSFAANTYSQFYKSLQALESKKIDSLIIDVRDNPGGHLQQTKQILSLFFNSKTVLYQIQSKGITEKVYSYNNESRKYPIAIMVNGGSASASEIVAACFKDNYKKAIIVGTKTYGKGTVQKTQSLTNGTTIKYTTERWLTPKGKWIDQKGVEPTINVEQQQSYYDTPTDDNDIQLQEALKKLKESN
ncbi:MAG: S41 family peptidase [Bacilli bacterium]|nr:S41 family peptidase [Bacilli bacterium]